MSLHSTLTGSDLHEPKGASTAALGSIYVSDGAGSGVWKTLPISSIDQTSVKGLNTRVVAVVFPVVTTAGSIQIPITENCSLVSVTGVLSGTVANDVALTVNAGLTGIGSGTAIASGSVKGTTVSITCSANSLSPGSYVEIVSAGATGTAAAMTFLFKFSVS